MVHHPPTSPSIDYVYTFALGDTEVRPADTNATLESTLTAAVWQKVHVSQLIRGCFYQLRRIKTVCNFILTSAAVSLINIIIVSKGWLLQRNSILVGLQTFQLDRIQPRYPSSLSVSYVVGHHSIIQPIWCVTTYIGCVFPSGWPIGLSCAWSCIKH